jgi:hypothetical protein
MISSDSFCLLVCSSLLSTIICYKAFCLHVVSSFFCSLVFHPKFGLLFNSFAIAVFVSLSFQVHPVVVLTYFISAALILLESLALTAQFSIPYNKAGRASVLYYILCP